MKIMNGLDLLNQKVVNLGDPSSATDAANKQYVDNVARGLSFKQPVRAAATGNVSIATPGATMDGVSLTTNDRVLLMNQTTPSQNGLYVWTGASSALTRALDADSGAELAPGTAVYVTEGSTNGDKLYAIISDAAITIGTTSMTWGQIGGGTTYTAGNGLSLTGTTFAVEPAPGGGLSVSGSGVAIDTSVVARKASGNIGNGSATSISFTHNLGTKDVVVAVREVASDAGVLVDWTATDINTVTLTFASAPASNAYRLTVVG